LTLFYLLSLFYLHKSLRVDHNTDNRIYTAPGYLLLRLAHRKSIYYWEKRQTQNHLVHLTIYFSTVRNHPPLKKVIGKCTCSIENVQCYKFSSKVVVISMSVLHCMNVVLREKASDKLVCNTRFPNASRPHYSHIEHWHRTYRFYDFFVHLYFLLFFLIYEIFSLKFLNKSLQMKRNRHCQP
jgi:hypothetical protein